MTEAALTLVDGRAQVRPADIPRMSQLRARDMLFMTPPAPRPAGAVAT